MWLLSRLYAKARQLAAMVAPGPREDARTSNVIQSTPTQCQTQNTDDASSIVCPPLSPAVTGRIVKNTRTTEHVVSRCSKSGVRIARLFYFMSKRFRAGIILVWTWTGSTILKVMHRATCAFARDERMCETEEVFPNLRKKSEDFANVFDIVNAGPRNRFTIKTDSGHLLVHNSGFGGWIKAWQKFGADKFLDEEGIKKSILAWRRKSPAIVELWAQLEDAAIRAIDNPGQCYSYKRIAYQMHGGVLYCQLPSGRAIPYHGAAVHDDMRNGKATRAISYYGVNSQSKQWVRMHTYGGKLAENCTQATARDIFAAGIVRLEDAGYPVVLHSHDEPTTEVPVGFGSIEEIERLITVPLEWCPDWPVKASGGWVGQRYRKG